MKNNFYQFVNKKWLEETEIPESRPSISAFHELVFKIEDQLMEDIKELSENNLNLDIEMKNFIKLYNLSLNFDKKNKEGIKPLKKYLDFLLEINNFDDFNKKLKHLVINSYPLPFYIYLNTDMKDSKSYSIYLTKADTILPNKEYYYSDKKDKFMPIYEKMSLKLLKLFFSNEESEKILKEAIEFDASFIEYIKTPEENSDFTKRYNPRNINEIKKYSSFINLDEIIQNVISKNVDNVIVSELKYFENIDKFINKNSFNLLKSWLILKLILSVKNLLDENIRTIGSEFENALKGLDKVLDKEKFFYNYTSNIFSDIIGIYYAKKYFSKKAKEDVENMVKSFIEIYKKRLEKNTWLKKETIQKAIKKLDTMEYLIAYPDTVNEILKKYKVNEEISFLENVLNIRRINTIDNFKKYMKKVDRLEWIIPAHTVNAFYNPIRNIICFPAGILQEPFYSLTQSKSENFGGIGAVIAHEISHSFDTNGAKFDENGNLNNWWDIEDLEKFNKLTEKMVSLFENISFGDTKVNSKLTLSENIADCGGLMCSLEALKQTENYSLKDFFINWARIWRNKTKKEYINLLLSSDTHSPGEIRANYQLSNIDDFYNVFDISKEDKMYIEKEKRVVIW